MKRIRSLSENTYIKLFFFLSSLAFLIGAVCMPDRANMLSGFLTILCSPTKLSANFFATGGYAGTFLNMGLVGLISAGLYCIPAESKGNPGACLAHLLTLSFGAWGLNVLNIWPGIFGVMLYSFVKKKPLGGLTNAMLFTTGLAPVASEFMLRYPNTEAIGFSFHGVVLALIVGIAIGYTLPAGLEISPKVHKGLDIFSAALPIGMMGFLIQGLFYKSMGIAMPAAFGADMTVASAPIVNIFCIAFFGACILSALLIGCNPKDYWKLLTSRTGSTNFAAAYGFPVALMNLGVFGLFILSYYNLIGAPMNGATFGTIFAMACTFNSGSHPFNVLPLILGYVGAATGLKWISGAVGGEFTQLLNAQPIIVGICYANGLSPITDRYGWVYGLLAAAAHYCMVTTVPNIHGGLVLYNGGFTAALVCILCVPVLEKLCKSKEERLALKQ